MTEIKRMWLLTFFNEKSLVFSEKRLKFAK